MTTSFERSPHLLVSVRSNVEAAAAITGGCDILDVKEPNRGSLGAADLETVAAICQVGARLVRPVPISVALGELSEWPEDRPVPSLPDGVSFAKLGLSGCRDAANWVSWWKNVRQRFDEAAEGELSWIAVLYADANAAGPVPETLIDAAAKTGCRGLLVDTFSKETGRLFDHVTPEQVALWRDATYAAGLLFAVAGSLRASDLPRLKDIAPDIIAVRGAVCRDADRAAEVDENAVRTFRRVLEKR